jgi:hypothetical protein
VSAIVANLGVFAGLDGNGSKHCQLGRDRRNHVGHMSMILENAAVAKLALIFKTICLNCQVQKGLHFVSSHVLLWAGLQLLSYSEGGNAGTDYHVVGAGIGRKMTLRSQIDNAIRVRYKQEAIASTC